MCRKFEELQAAGEKVGEPSKVLQAQLAALQAEQEDTSCGYIEEGQDGNETPGNSSPKLNVKDTTNKDNDNNTI